MIGARCFRMFMAELEMLSNERVGAAKNYGRRPCVAFWGLRGYPGFQPHRKTLLKEANDNYGSVEAPRKILTTFLFGPSEVS